MRPSLFATLLVLMFGCSPDLHIEDGDASPDAGDGGVIGDTGSDSGDAGAEGWRFELIETRDVPLGAGPRTVELIRAHRPDGERTYLLYIPAIADDAPLVISNQPYDGIDWTGEAVDARWAALGDGAHPDVDAPGYDGDDVVGYTLKTVPAAVNDSALFLLNDFAVVHTYGRFYAGGSLEDDILDASAAYHFALSRDDELDLDRVASVGGSWGGMMALFGASRAPAGITLRSLVPLTPVSDYVDFWEWVVVRAPEEHSDPALLATFYSPYLRRIYAATTPDAPGTPPDEAVEAWARYRAPAICAGLRALDPGVRVLATHDAWDVLVPVRETETLVAACPELVRGLYWPRDGAIPYAELGLSHGPFATEEPGLPVMFTLGYLDIALALTRADQMALTAAVPAALDAYLMLLRAEQLRGGDVGYAAGPLAMLCDPRTTYFDGVSMTIEPGTALITGALSRVYGVDPATACSTLAAGLPTP